MSRRRELSASQQPNALPYRWIQLASDRVFVRVLRAIAAKFLHAQLGVNGSGRIGETCEAASTPKPTGMLTVFANEVVDAAVDGVLASAMREYRWLLC